MAKHSPPTSSISTMIPKKKTKSTSALGYVWFYRAYYIVSFPNVFYLSNIVCKHLIHVL